MQIVKVLSGNRVTIPQKWLEKLGVKTGEYVSLDLLDTELAKQVIVQPVVWKVLEIKGGKKK